MKELKDIVLNKGDIVYFDDGDRYIPCFGLDNNTLDGLTKTGGYRVIKIERPVKYKTIYEAPKQILDKEEKEYLENVIRPFRDRVRMIRKCKYNEAVNERLEHIAIYIKNDMPIILPDFQPNTMYKGMEVGKEYTLKELGLFKE